MKYCILFFAAVVLIFGSAYAQNRTILDDDQNYYIGTNPVSYISALRLQDDIKRFIPEASGLEYGLSIVGGHFASPNQIPEARFSVGNIHRVARVWQVHAGMNYFPLTRHKQWFRNIYIGGFCKFWDYYNRLTKVNFYNIAPYVTAGYLFQTKAMLFDVRLNQTVAVYSWSDLEHSSAGMAWFFSPWPAFIPVMPSLTFTVGWKF